MPRIRCRYLDCVYLDDGYCSSEVVEIDPDEGCMTFTLITDANDDDWDDEKIEDLWDVDDDDLLVDDDDDLDLWLEEDL
jgi:hypothetical protein